MKYSYAFVRVIERKQFIDIKENCEIFHYLCSEEDFHTMKSNNECLFNYICIIININMKIKNFTTRIEIRIFSFIYIVKKFI